MSVWAWVPSPWGPSPAGLPTDDPHCYFTKKTELSEKDLLPGHPDLPPLKLALLRGVLPAPAPDPGTQPSACPSCAPELSSPLSHLQVWSRVPMLSTNHPPLWTHPARPAPS